MGQSQNLINQLLEKSQEAFIVGIELYNKPTIKYRVEGFSFFICNAWELMLKAYLIKRDGEESIYYPNDRKRTKNLSNCIEQIFTNKKDPLRMNLEQIIDLRNTSTHFITEEYEQIYVPFFQSCVLNYTNKLAEFFGIDITKNIPSNFLVLSVKLSPISPEEVHARYPQEIANRVLQTVGRLNDSLPENGNDRYAVMIKHDIYITKKADLASTTVRFAKDAKEAAFIIKDTKDMQKLCPHRRGKCIELINKKLKMERINFINPSKLPTDEKYNTFTTNNFDCIVKFYQIKENPKLCYKYEIGTQTLYSYSDAAIELIVEEIKKDPEHIIQNLRNKQKKELTPGAKEF